MDRRKALTVAGAIAGVVLSGSAAFALNLGLADAGTSDQPDEIEVGDLAELVSDPFTTTTAPITVIIEDLPAPPPAAAAVPTEPTGAPLPAVTSAPSPTPSVGDFDHDDDHDHDDRERDDHDDDDDDDDPGDDSSGSGSGRRGDDGQD